MCRRANDDLTQTSGQPTSDSSNPVDGLAQASLLSRLTFGWVYPLLALGRSRPLTETDLPQTPDPEQSIVLYEALEARWAHELQRSPSAPSFARALILDSLPTLLPAALIAVLESAMQITQAVCLGLHHVSNPQSNTSLALTLTLTLALALALALALTLTLTLALPRWSRHWRSQLRDVLLLLEELARQAAHRNEGLGVNASMNASAADAPTLTLALVHLPTQEENRRFLLLVGSGAPRRP